MKSGYTGGLIGILIALFLTNIFQNGEIHDMQRDIQRLQAQVEVMK